MFGRRKSDDGFEWHKYVRTTIKLKREQRRQRILEARRAAVHQAGAGRRGARRRVAGGGRGGAGRRASVGLGIAGLVAQAAWNIVATMSAIAWHHLCNLVGNRCAETGDPVAARHRRAGAPQHRRARRAGGRHRAGHGHRPLQRRRPRPRGDHCAGDRRRPAHGLAASAVEPDRHPPAAPSRRSASRRASASLRSRAAVLLAGVAWMASGGKTSLASLSSQLPLVGGAKPLQGRAEAIGGDIVRVAGTTRPARRHRGARAPADPAGSAAGAIAVGRRRMPPSAGSSMAARSPARSAAATTPGSRSPPARAATSTSTASWCARATCSPAAACLPATPASSAQARDAKAGIWAAGEVERPAEFRAKAWDEAKRRAPDGCPIKGLVTGGERVYVLPGSPDYDRGRIQKARGERWFCSEREAEAAGFKPAVRG